MKLLTARLGRHTVDLLVLTLAFFAAFYIRFDGEVTGQMLKRMLFLTPYVVIWQFAVMGLLGIPRFPWRYVSMREVMQIGLATSISAVPLAVMRAVMGQFIDTWGPAQYAMLPYGVIIIDYILVLFGVTGVRALWRLRIEHQGRQQNQGADGQISARVLLIGAGSAGVLVAREVVGRPNLGITPIGFVDDDPAKQRAIIHGLKVLGTTEDIPALVRTHDIAQVVITIAAASGSAIRDIVRRCEAANVRVQIIPGIDEILDGKVALSAIRPVQIDDLLGRDAVVLEEDLVGQFLSNRSVMVTGAGGSIGSEICRQVARLKPKRIVLFERAEPALFNILRELRQSFGELEIIAALGDVTDADRVEDTLERWRPHVIFHAAAHKHVPLVEENPGEAIRNNVIGTRRMADAADKYGVESFVMVSTDKAVNPTSVMGATKRVAEIYIQAMAQTSATRFVAVRFGNVLGSAGSVVPIFQAQIEAGGPVTVTHPKMTRYFMTIPEASQLVMQAGAMGDGGEIFVLDMGEPVHIVDLARDLIKLSGLEPDVDIPITFTGVRPGEKLFEEIGFDAEKMDKTRHPKIFTGRLQPAPFKDVKRQVDSLRDCLQARDRDEVLGALTAIVPEMQEDARSEAHDAKSGAEPLAAASLTPSEQMP
ncbi:MAG: polysaccharide biosynthesis protein [Myxococcota bacterium]